MERKDYAEKFRDIKDEILDEIRGILGNGEKHYFKETFFVHYVEGEVATTEVCSALEISEKGMVVFHVINSVQDAEKIEAHGVYAYDPESFLDILDHLKKDVREKKFQILRKLLKDNGGSVKIDSQTVVGILGERKEYPCIVEELHLKDGKIEIIDNYEGDKFTNSEAELATQSIDRLINSVRQQTKRKFVIRVSGSFSRTFDIEASSYKEALEFAKTEWKEDAPLCPDDSNGEDWEDYTSVAH